jgi:restriction system protein
VTGDYKFNSDAPVPFKHSRAVKWIAKDIPRSIFDQDLLYALGGIQTVYKVEKNDAERRIRRLAEKGWKSSLAETASETSDHGEGEEGVDLEQFAKDNIAKLITQRFKGHGLARLVNALLRVQGYSTHLSPEGSDKGIDILAAPGPMGFGTPRLCVQVKSGDSPVDSPTLQSTDRVDAKRTSRTGTPCILGRIQIVGRQRTGDSVFPRATLGSR